MRFFSWCASLIFEYDFVALHSDGRLKPQEVTGISGQFGECPAALFVDRLFISVMIAPLNCISTTIFSGEHR